MASPFTFSVTKPASGDALNAFPAFVQGQWAALATIGATGGALGTLIPFGTATTGWRVVQDANVVYVVTNAYLSGHAGTWAQDDATVASYGFLYDPTTNNSVRVVYMAAGQTTWTGLADFPATASAVNYIQLIAAATTAAVQVRAAGTDSNITLGLTPKGTGNVRIPNNIILAGRKADNSLDLQIATYTAGNVLQLGDGGNSGTQIYSGAAGVQIDAPITNIGSTATMGLTLKKGSGGGNYTTNSATFVRVDATNLAHAVTVPTGWKLGIWANCEVFSTAASTNWSIALADGTADNTGILVSQSIQESGGRASVSISWVLAGDGASHTINLQWHAGGSTENMDNSSATIVPTMIFLLVPSN